MKFFVRYIIFALFLILPFGWVEASSGFNSPANYPTGTTYTNGNRAGGDDGWGFLEWNGDLWHPGEDWNRGSGSLDYGDPVASIASGDVITAGDLGIGWGKSVLISHGDVYSFYTHLSSINVSSGASVSSGQLIGKIGDANGRWVSHLHFEIRKQNLPANYWPKGLTREQVLQKYYAPTDFINSHRPPKSSTLTATPGQGVVNLSWTKSEDPQFDRYEIYRSQTSGGTLNPASRTLVYSSKDPATLLTQDDKVPIGASYFRIITYFKTGLTAESAEVAVESRREVMQLTPSTYYQGSPTIIGNKVFFEDLSPSGYNANRKLTYYDLTTKKIEGVDIPTDMTYAYVPHGTEHKIAYYSYNRNGCNRVFYYNFETSTNIPASIVDNSCSQVNPDISASGNLFWQQLGSDKLYKIYQNDTSGSAGPSLVSNFPSNQINPRVDGDNLIWKDSRNSKSYDIYLKNFSSGAESRLAVDTGDGRADIWGKYVVWDNKGKISMINIETKEQKVITSAGGGYYPSISDGKIAYTLLEGATSFVHVYDVATTTDTKIDVPLHATSFPSFGSGYVAWDDTTTWPSSDKNIYLTKL
jgi:beta propeller repeat protein